MDNPEEVLHILDEFAKLKPKDIPKELEDYLSYVARTGDPVYQWSLVKCLFREKLLRVITDFYESTALINPPSPAGDSFNYEGMKRVLLERLETFSNAPFTVQRLCELLTAPRKQYNRTDKFMRAIEKNILVVSTREPGSACRQDNNLSEPLPNGVSDGESLGQNVKNDTVHLGSESPVNEAEDAGIVESSLSDDNHVDIGSIEAGGSLAAAASKDLEPVNLEVANSCDQTSDGKLNSDTRADLDDESCKISVSSENQLDLVQQNQLVDNVESSDKTDPVVQSGNAECVDSTDQATAEGENEQTEQPVIEEDRKLEPEPTDSRKEDAVTENNECQSKDEEDSGVRQVNDEASQIVGKPLVGESDVSCSSSDTPTWSTSVSEESDGVSTTEAESEASSSEAVGEPALPEEEVDATSSDAAKDVPVCTEESKIGEKSNERTEDLKTIGSSSDSSVSADHASREGDAVGVADKDAVEEPLTENSEGSQGQSPVVEETCEVPPKSEIPEESTVMEAPVPETSVVEAPVISTHQDSEAVSADSATGSEVSKEAVPESGPKEKLPAPEEAMDIDESNSCHSTEVVPAADQGEPMDDTE